MSVPIQNGIVQELTEQVMVVEVLGPDSSDLHPLTVGLIILI